MSLCVFKVDDIFFMSCYRLISTYKSSCLGIIRNDRTNNYGISSTFVGCTFSTCLTNLYCTNLKLFV